MDKKVEVKLFMNVAQNFKWQADKPEKFELFTTGYIKEKKDRWVIEYENEYNGVSKIFLFKDKRVEIVSSGDVSYVLQLNRDCDTRFTCNTKETFSYFSVKTKNIYFNILKTGGKIDLEYDLQINDSNSMMQNVINIAIKRVEEQKSKNLESF